ncbi:hypothetical protein GQ457_03G035110 [Hibiscus cannabinus]
MPWHTFVAVLVLAQENPLPGLVEIHHAHLMAMLPTRVPLPLDLKEDEPIFVNAKQYHAILRRRQYRAKLEAQNKFVRVQKLKRARGSGGQFLNTETPTIQELSDKPGPGMSRSPQLHLSANMSSNINTLNTTRKNELS